MHALPLGLISSFSCSFRENIGQIVGWRPPPRGADPLGNTGSATAHEGRKKSLHISDFLSRYQISKDLKLNFIIYLNDICCIYWIVGRSSHKMCM